MRILQIVNPVLPIPPTTMGGTERIVHALILELLKRGHEVTLLGEDNSKLPAAVEFHGIGTYWNQKHACNKVWRHLAKNGSRYDVIHNHGRLLFHLPALWRRTPKVHTFHFGELLLPQLNCFRLLRPRGFAFVPCGHWISEKYNHVGGRWRSIHNGIAADLYTPNYSVASDAPLVSIGRMDPRKGAPQAINVAKASGRRLIIAGVVGDQPHERSWFEKSVLQQCDGVQIQFVGPVDDAQKQTLLTESAGLLLPIQGSEAFTVVMLEALACGCPVIGYDAYCIPELVRDGYNGFLVKNEKEMALAVNKLGMIDRRNCRLDFEHRFTAEVMASRYLQLYADLKTSAW
jgi:glycosyltransferase involved in cell wall biosynthesis